MSEATVIEIWRERDTWAEVARTGKKRQENVRFVALCCGVAGAFLGTLAGLVASYGRPLGILSAVLIGLGGYLGRELLTSDRETEWTRARVLAESLQRECWLYLMKVSPYDNSGGMGHLRKRATVLMANLGLSGAVRPPEREVKLPKASSVEEYIRERLEPQVKWYEKRSNEHRGQQSRYRQATLLLGAIAVIAGIVGSSYQFLLAFVPVITTATAALVAWMESNRVGSLVSLYQDTATQLRLLIAEWRDTEDDASAPPEDCRTKGTEFVAKAEDIMARENGSWRAEWLSQEKANQARGAQEKVISEAQKASSPKL